MTNNKGIAQTLADLGNIKQAYNYLLLNNKNIFNFEKEDIKQIRNSILKMDHDIETIYKTHKKEYTTHDRPTLKNIVNSWCEAFRCSSLYLD